MKNTVVILQSNYIPWKGYFDLINDADLFIFHDDLQYTKNDWRNRNKIKDKRGLEWLSIPVGSDEHRLICEVKINDSSWQKKHWTRLKDCYSSTPYFHAYKNFFEGIYLDTTWGNLSELNQTLIKRISHEILNISTVFADSREYNLIHRKQERVLELLAKSGAERYISGPSAKAYIDENRFNDIGIEIIWKDYSNYPEYPQTHPPFEHGVTILDLLFNVGPEAPWFIWGWREGKEKS